MLFRGVLASQLYVYQTHVPGVDGPDDFALYEELLSRQVRQVQELNHELESVINIERIKTPRFLEGAQPEVWLEHIANLINKGEVPKARATLVEFNRRFLNYEGTTEP